MKRFTTAIGFILMLVLALNIPLFGSTPQKENGKRSLHELFSDNDFWNDGNTFNNESVYLTGEENAEFLAGDDWRYGGTINGKFNVRDSIRVNKTSIFVGAVTMNNNLTVTGTLTTGATAQNDSLTPTSGILTLIGNFLGHGVSGGNTYALRLIDPSASTNIFRVDTLGNVLIAGTLGVTGVISGTSPAITTSMTTPSTTFTLLNTTATTVNAFGAATAITMGAAATGGTITLGKSADATGYLNVINTLQTTSATTGAIKTAGGIAAAKSVYAGHNVFVDSAVVGTAYLRGTASFTTTALFKAVYVPGMIAGDIVVVTPNMASAIVSPGSGEFFGVFTKTDSIIVSRNTGTISGESFNYIRIR